MNNLRSELEWQSWDDWKAHCRKHHLHLQQIGGSQENGEEPQQETMV